MIRDFNIKDNNWNLLYSHHSTHADTLREIADLFDLELSTSINQVFTCYADNFSKVNSVINSMFL